MAPPLSKWSELNHNHEQGWLIVSHKRMQPDQTTRYMLALRVRCGSFTRSESLILSGSFLHS